MKYMTFFSRNRIQSRNKSGSGTALYSGIIRKLFLSLLALAYGCFAIGVQASGDEEYSAAWQEAFALIDKRNRKKATLKLEALLQTDLSESKKREIHHALGYNYEKLRNRPKAVGHYARVASVSYPLADYAVYRLARLYEGMNNRSRAIKWYTQLVKDYPRSFYLVEAKWALAQLHLEEKQYASAKSVLVELVEQPRYAREVSFALARCNEELGDIPTAFNTYREHHYGKPFRKRCS